MEIREEIFENIVFLDIDGVMNDIFSNEYFTKEAIDTLNDLYEKINYKIVLSSSWKNAFTLYKMQEIFKNIGIKAPLIDKTMTFFKNDPNKRNNITLDELDNLEIDKIYTRDYEINMWIKVFKPKHFVILDDFFFDDEILKEHLVQTSFFGLEKDKGNLSLRKELIPIILEKFKI